LSPPPSSTLFPYTTLFRSVEVRVAGHARIVLIRGRALPSPRKQGGDIRPFVQSLPHVGAPASDQKCTMVDVYVPTYRFDGYRLRSEEHTSELQSRRDLVCR